MTSPMNQLLEEHLELLGEIESLRQWWSDLDAIGEPRFDEIAGRVVKLRNDLVQHFEHEEEGGYLVEVVDAEPRLATKVESLRRQHATFLRVLDELIDVLVAEAVPVGAWNTAQEAFEAFTRRLLDHEKAERALVLDAFETDVGTGD